jgi:hypothetical protein
MRVRRSISWMGRDSCVGFHALAVALLLGSACSDPSFPPQETDDDIKGTVPDPAIAMAPSVGGARSTANGTAAASPVTTADARTPTTSTPTAATTPTNPTRAQDATMRETLDRLRELYNAALEHRARSVQATTRQRVGLRADA